MLTGHVFHPVVLDGGRLCAERECGADLPRGQLQLDDEADDLVAVVGHEVLAPERERGGQR